MLIEQIAELQLRGFGSCGLTCTSITGYFHDKTKISKENIRVGFHLLLKCCTGVWGRSPQLLGDFL